MDRIEQTYSVLTVSAADKFSASLHTLLPEGQYDPVRAVRDAASPFPQIEFRPDFHLFGRRFRRQVRDGGDALRPRYFLIEYDRAP